MSKIDPENEANPYAPPLASYSESAHLSNEAKNATLFAVCVIIGIAVGAVAGFLTWIGLILTFFARSTEYWPGWACAPPALFVFGLTIVFFATIVRKMLMRLV